MDQARADLTVCRAATWGDEAMGRPRFAWQELKISSARVSLTTIHPGGIKTNTARNARFDDIVAELAGDSGEARRDFDKLFVTSPEKAARQILTAVQRDRRRALIGPHQGVHFVSRLPAGFYQRLVENGARARR
jgi:butyryl-CoA dehydrogenase